MRILITSNQHVYYDQTGEIIDLVKEENQSFYLVQLDNQKQASIRESEFKVID